MPNRLLHSTSPYLLQHAHNPVDWYPWGEEALAKARAEDKPIFLSIGYAACHWCHVMAHESFEDPATAAIMNEHFVNIKVDREERPDLDQIYMQAVVALTGQGGWPLSVFLTPEGTPFYGGTYFPPVRRFGMPAFKEVLLGVAHAWQHERERILQAGEQLRQHLHGGLRLPEGEMPLHEDLLRAAVRVLREQYDAQNGGWGDAPKFPQAMALEFLLRQATRGHADALPMAEHALQAMARGGIWDVVGGGFHRYSVDMRWHVPHFEKMLYDNALLARAYLYAFLLTGKTAYRQVCERTLDFVLREMSHPQGGFYASLDADSEGEEGRFYTWTPDELRAALGEEDAAFCMAAFGVHEAGHMESGRSVLQRALEDEALAARFQMPVPAVAERLQRIRARLLEARAARVRPATDDKVVLVWNALMVAVLAESGRYLGRGEYTAAATRSAAFLCQHLLTEDHHLFRIWHQGRRAQPAFLDDYAALILALLELYQTDAQPRWFTLAERLTHTLLDRFQAPDGGFFDTPHDHESLFVRPREMQDNAVPSGNALAVQALLRMSHFTGRGDLRDLAEQALRRMVGTAARYPTHFAAWLNALDFAVGPVQEVVIAGDPAADGTRDLLREVWRTYRPRLLLALTPQPADVPPLLQGRTLLGGQPTAYVCQHMTCRQPVTDPAALAALLT